MRHAASAGRPRARLCAPRTAHAGGPVSDSRCLYLRGRGCGGAGGGVEGAYGDAYSAGGGSDAGAGSGAGALDGFGRRPAAAAPGARRTWRAVVRLQSGGGDGAEVDGGGSTRRGGAGGMAAVAVRWQRCGPRPLWGRPIRTGEGSGGKGCGGKAAAAWAPAGSGIA